MNPFDTCKRAPKIDGAVKSITSVLEKAQADAAKVRAQQAQMNSLHKKLAAAIRKADKLAEEKREALKKCAEYQATIAELRDRAKPLQIQYRPGQSAWPEAGECRAWAKAVTQ